ncbi:MAG: PRC-barrel domain-containing protein [Gammaproteobacteria bacterium]
MDAIHSETELKPVSALRNCVVRDDRGKRLGHIEDFMLDFPTGAIAYVVLAFGGLLGLGNKLCAVSPDMLNFEEIKDCFRLRGGKDTLKKALMFNRYDWTNLSAAAHLSKLYRLQTDDILSASHTDEQTNRERNTHEMLHASNLQPARSRSRSPKAGVSV